MANGKYAARKLKKDRQQRRWSARSTRAANGASTRSPTRRRAPARDAVSLSAVRE